jgi:hypothetical protein
LKYFFYFIFIFLFSSCISPTEESKLEPVNDSTKLEDLSKVSVVDSNSSISTEVSIIDTNSTADTNSTVTDSNLPDTNDTVIDINQSIIDTNNTVEVNNTIDTNSSVDINSTVDTNSTIDINQNVVDINNSAFDSNLSEIEVTNTDTNNSYEQDTNTTAINEESIVYLDYSKFKFTYEKALEYSELLDITISNSYLDFNQSYNQVWLSSGMYYDYDLDSNFSAYPDEYKYVVFEGNSTVKYLEFNLTNYQANWYIANELCQNNNQILPTIEQFKLITYQNLDVFTGEFWTSNEVDGNSSMFRIVGNDEKYHIEEHMIRSNYKGVLCVDGDTTENNVSVHIYDEDSGSLLYSNSFLSNIGIFTYTYLDTNYFLNVDSNTIEQNVIYSNKVEYGVWTLDSEVEVTYDDFYKEYFVVSDNYSSIWLLKDKDILTINIIDNFNFDNYLEGANISLWKSPEFYINTLDNGCSLDNVYCNRVHYYIFIKNSYVEELEIGITPTNENEVPLDTYFIVGDFLFISLENNSTYVLLVDLKQ